MLHTLDYFAEQNDVIDELVEMPPRKQKVLLVRACNPLFRTPFIEITLDDGQVIQRKFSRRGFAEAWSEAAVILEAITSIKTESEFDFEPVASEKDLIEEVLQQRQVSIADTNEMFDSGMYKVFLYQFGRDCKNLPADTIRKIHFAQQEMKKERDSKV